jgi:hypothetical protein
VVIGGERVSEKLSENLFGAPQNVLAVFSEGLAFMLTPV